MPKPVLTMTSTIRRFSNGMYGLPLPTATAKKFLDKGIKRVVCTLNGKYPLHAAILKLKDEPYYITTGKRVLKELSLAEGVPVQFTLKEDKAPLQFECPEEWQEVINTDPEAGKVFDGLTDGNKRGLISLVLMVKSPQKRVDRALRIAENLKRGLTSPRQMMK